MNQATRGPPAEMSPGPGPISLRTPITATMIMAVSLGLASCVGPYAGEGPSQYGYDPGMRRDAGYDQRRGENYRYDPYNRYDPYAALGEQPRDGWWDDNAFSRRRNNR